MYTLYSCEGRKWGFWLLLYFLNCLEIILLQAYIVLPTNNVFIKKQNEWNNVYLISFVGLGGWVARGQGLLSRGAHFMVKSQAWTLIRRGMGVSPSEGCSLMFFFGLPAPSLPTPLLQVGIWNWCLWLSTFLSHSTNRNSLFLRTLYGFLCIGPSFLLAVYCWIGCLTPLSPVCLKGGKELLEL